MVKLPDQYKKIFGYLLIGISVTPQVLFAIGAAYPPAAAAAIAVQNVLQLIGIQPGLVQAASGVGGGAILQKVDPK